MFVSGYVCERTLLDDVRVSLSRLTTTTYDHHRRREGPIPSGASTSLDPHDHLHDPQRPTEL